MRKYIKKEVKSCRFNSKSNDKLKRFDRNPTKEFNDHVSTNCKLILFKIPMEKLMFKKLHPEAMLPSRGSDESCGLDLYSVEEVTIKKGTRQAVKTGLASAIPLGYYGRVAPRSGLALKSGIDVMAGVIDSDYRGEIICLLINLGETDFEVIVGQRIAQLIVEKVAILIPDWSDDLGRTTRNNNGFGSSGL